MLFRAHRAVSNRLGEVLRNVEDIVFGLPTDHFCHFVSSSPLERVHATHLVTGPRGVGSVNPVTLVQTNGESEQKIHNNASTQPPTPRPCTKGRREREERSWEDDDERVRHVMLAAENPFPIGSIGAHALGERRQIRPSPRLVRWTTRKSIDGR
ncbi:hypothetical protein M422DRAFT_783991 [Sphaerobolus stellatus SS14]|uniref:Uncharacterized protein n=1 Tax=Sphaerobolus stellatus (strain SS14) TaxID=990650 RepID=A0A0C9TKX5_SPHS4|nr:hypothetical protein M422DRAFT_783991 [Sphaerobolus stellatus SS14]